MMGIQNLKDRQGLSMDASIVHGRPEELQVWSSSFFLKRRIFSGCISVQRSRIMQLPLSLRRLNREDCLQAHTLIVMCTEAINGFIGFQPVHPLPSSCLPRPPCRSWSVKAVDVGCTRLSSIITCGPAVLGRALPGSEMALGGQGGVS